MPIKKRSSRGPKVSGNGKTMAIIMHILGIFFWFIPALIVYLAADDSFTKENAKNALNWQVSATIYAVISVLLILVIVGIVLLALLGIANMVFSIVAALKASDGEAWKYPLAIKFID